jgi:N utilization substance protein B
VIQSEIVKMEGLTPLDEAAEELQLGDLPPRRRARAVAMLCLYEYDLVGHPMEECLVWLLQELPKTSAAVDRFVRELAQGVLAHQEMLDLQIQTYAPAWPVQQLSVVDRSLLRMAIYEIITGRHAPPKAVINEVVELAKLYGSESSPRFINGVMGSVMEKSGQESSC